jgi:decaprenylphospho-beta-D-erythro-pentofuranosid-2-ulose 2-reductase
MARILILGATSAISRSMARLLAAQGHSLFLAGRDEEDLTRLACDLSVRYGAAVYWGAVDAQDFGSHESFLRRVYAVMGPVDGVVCAIGYLGAQPEDSKKEDAVRRIADTNFTGPVSLIAPLANQMEASGSGFILGISSVAGDRGRQSNYAYGAAKGAFSLYLQGLRNRLHTCGVRVITIKLGFVDTAMTYGKPGLFLVAAPEKVARRLCRLSERAAGEYYVPRFWWLLMLVIRSLPEAVFKRLKL